MKKLLLFGTLFLLILAVDLVTKECASAWLSHTTHSFVYPFGGVPVFQNVFGISLSFNYVENTGAAWGMLSEYTLFLLFFRVILVGYLLYTLSTQKKPVLFQLGVVCILSGACGNIIDMLRFGYVVDMIKVVLFGYHYPVFNVADSAIVGGLVALLAAEFFIKGTKKAGSFV